MRARVRAFAIAVLMLGLVGGSALPPAGAQADPRMFPETGYRVDNDAFWAYFQSRGALTTFGYPASVAFPFLGCTSQFFQRLVMQRCSEGGVVTLNLLDDGLLPYTAFNGSIVPAPDAALKNATPRPDDPAYGRAILDYVRNQAPDSFDGEPVNFQTTFFTTITAAQAGTNDPNLLGLLDLELWGAPTSAPAHDPSNAGFIYQRFQRGIMHYDKACGCTRGLLLADYLKALITGQNVPGDLAAQAGSSPLVLSAVNGQTVDGTDYNGAFIGVTRGSNQATSTPVATSPPLSELTSTPVAPLPEATSTPVAQPDSALGRTKETAPGQVQGGLAFVEPKGTERCSAPDVSGTLQIDVRPNTTSAYPDVFTICLSSVISQADVRLNVTPNGGGGNLKVADLALGWKWPPNEPADPADYTLNVTQAGRAASPDTLVQVTNAKDQKPKLLVFPRRGAPGTTFDVYLGGFPPGQPATLRLYRCEVQGGCKDSDKRVYVTSLPPIAVDGAGRAKMQLHSRSSDPKTEFALLSDEMITRVQAAGGIFDDDGGVGKAWFCTAAAPTCTTERD
jgi:hypothetical protein